jgi:hypothetical protein
MNQHKKKLYPKSYFFIYKSKLFEKKTNLFGLKQTEFLGNGVRKSNHGCKRMKAMTSTARITKDE